MNALTLRRAPLALACTLLLVSAKGDASTLQLDPVLIEVTPDKSAAALTVTNSGTEPVSIRVRVTGWRQDAGADSYMETSDIILSPPIARIAPGAKQIIRVGPHPGPRLQERAYRVVVQEVPEQRPSAGTVGIVLGFNLPLFVLSPRHAPASVHWIAQRRADGTMIILGTNVGGTHFDVQSLSWTGPGNNGDVLSTKPGSVLVNGTKAWVVGRAPALKAGDQVMLKVKASGREQQVPVALQGS